MTCREFTDFIVDYLAGELADPQREQFDQHLSVCDNCCRYLEDYKAAIRLGKRAFEDSEAPLPADIPEDLVRAILAARQKS